MRREKRFPIDIELCSYLKSAWENGWLDEYSDDHFLIKAIESRLDSFVAIDQMINNNINFMGMVTPLGNINSKQFDLNFCINFSRRLNGLSLAFGEEAIKRFITDQLSAGKQDYNEDTFFQALSEVSILSFFTALRTWDKVSYEPPAVDGINDKNPEASFYGTFICNSAEDPNVEVEKEIKLNVEVKSPQFPHDTHVEEKIAIPTVLLSKKGRAIVEKYCNDNGVCYLAPRVLKLRDFINSAASKFNVPQENEFNILYINWSFRDFPSNAFLEPWSLLTNENNGILINTKYADEIGITKDAYDKISAIVVYTESLEGIAFGDFRYVWQENGAGKRFRMWILDDKLRQAEENGSSNIMFRVTGMRPSKPLTQYVMLDYKSKNITEKAEGAYFGLQLYNLIKDNAN